MATDDASRIYSPLGLQKLHRDVAVASGKISLFNSIKTRNVFE